MEEYKRLQSQIDADVYKDLELFFINETNFTSNQVDRFVTLIERINKHSKDIKIKSFKEKKGLK